MKILLIAGHGDGDCGAIGNGYYEADLTREVATLLKAELDGCADVTIADTKKNWYKHIIQHKNYFNFKPYDYVLEIHFNSFANNSANGTGIYITRAEKSHGVETNIVKGISNIGFTYRGVTRKNYDLIHYIKNQGVSSALLEVCFISNKNDMNLYQAKKGEVIKAIADGIISGFSLEKKVDELTEACSLLASKGIINSPDYWAKGKGYSDENTVLLIKKFAGYVKGA
jgi:N-acetylmuramoyl-L-alanine amidase